MPRPGSSEVWAEPIGIQVPARDYLGRRKKKKEEKLARCQQNYIPKKRAGTSNRLGVVIRYFYFVFSQLLDG